MFWMGQIFSGFFVFLFFLFFFERTRPAASMRPPCLIYLSTSTRVLQVASHPTVGFALFGSNVSDRLSSSREELPVSMILL